MQKLTQFRGATFFFIAVFLNAFVDLGHKIVLQNTIFKLYDGPQQVILTAILNGLILLPYILLLKPAGRASDTFAKVEVMRATAITAVILCCGICIAYYAGWFWVAFGMTFLLAAQSAFYSPAKLGFIKELFGKQRLGEANGVTSALTICAILSGTFFFSILFESLFDSNITNKNQLLQHIAIIGWLLIATSVVELIVIFRLPRSTSCRPETIDVAPSPLNISQSISPIFKNKVIRLSAIGLATFWAIGQVMVAAFPAFIKEQTGIDNTILVQGILACSGLGIALGSFIAARASRDHIELSLLPLGAIGIAIGLCLLPTLSDPRLSALTFLFIGTAGGMFIVPLNALIQFHADDKQLGRTLAANNWLQNVAMCSFLVLTASFAYLSLSSKALLQLIAVVAIVGCGYTLYQLPQSFVRAVVSFCFRRRYRIFTQGIRNMPSRGGVLLLGNHVSWIDWAIIQLAMPRPVRFVMINDIYQRWYLRWIFDLFHCIPIEQGAGSRKAMDNVKAALQQGDVVCLFPEGTLSRTGHLVEFRRGYERICADLDNDIPIVPFHLHGLWGSRWSHASELVKEKSHTRSKRDIIIAFGPPLSNKITADQLKQNVFDLSIDSWTGYCDELPSLPEQWVESATRHKGQLIVDSSGIHLSGKKALLGSTLFAEELKHRLKGDNIGVALPASAGSALANMSILQLGKTLVNLNFTAGKEALQSATEQAQIQSIVTSRQFLKKLALKGIDLENIFAGCECLYLEDISAEISIAKKITYLLFIYITPASILKKLLCKKTNLDKTACILFSSGSEGSPKGVCLSHRNIAANIKQTLTVLNPQANDAMLGNLPPFHAFGLTVTQFLPLLEGIPVVFHPDPTDAFSSAKLISKHRLSILFGTSTFLRFYARNKKVHPLMLDSLRFVVSGAEKLNPKVKQDFEDKFKKPIYEGYGTTETTPVAAVNMPDQLAPKNFKVQRGNKVGSVGMPLPGTRIKIVDPETHKPLPTGEAGMIIIGGLQVMKGYLNNEEKNKQALLSLSNRQWYVTGDKGYLDEDGFLTIVDRYSRFAKIGGEMLSLSHVEQKLQSAILAQADDISADDFELLVVSIADDKKGEQLILLANAEVSGYLDTKNLEAHGLTALAKPSKVFTLASLPKLASGKADFSRAKSLANELSQQGE